MTDATFEEGRERPLRLIARDADDLQVISALVQDAVLTGTDLRYDARKRCFSILVNRFRWEDRTQADTGGAGHERVRAVLQFDDVLAVRHQGLETRDTETVLALLAISWAPDAAEAETAADAPAGPGRATLIFSGDGAVALDVECLEVQLCDVTRPYLAPSRRAPTHGVE